MSYLSLIGIVHAIGLRQLLAGTLRQSCEVTMIALPAPKYKVGDEVLIAYNGEIFDSECPPSVETITGVRYILETDDDDPDFGYDTGYEYSIVDGDPIHEIGIVGKVSELPKSFVDQALAFTEVVFATGTISEIEKWIAEHQNIG